MIMQVHDGRRVIMVVPGIYVHPVSLFAQFLGKLPDVDTHTPGIPGAQITDRAGVNAEHRNI